MRFLGEIVGRVRAEMFVAYLLTKDISTHIESAGAQSDEWEVWVRDEDKLVDAFAELHQFNSHPDDTKYHAAIAEATKILKGKREKQQRLAKNVHRVGGGSGIRPFRSTGLPPLTLTLLILCCAVSLISNFTQPGPNNKLGLAVLGQLMFVGEHDRASGDPAASLKKGELWRVITPIFLHGNPIHLVLNMMFLVSLGRVAERHEGTTRFAMLVLVTALIPNLWQGLAPAWMLGDPNFVGISGVLYGVFGYLWIKSTLRPEIGFRIPVEYVLLLLVLMAFGISGVFKNAANLCHLGGLLVGMALGWLAGSGSTFGRR